MGGGGCRVWWSGWWIGHVVGLCEVRMGVRVRVVVSSHPFTLHPTSKVAY